MTWPEAKAILDDLNKAALDDPSSRLGLRCTGIAPEDERIERKTGMVKSVDLAQNETCRRWGIVTAAGVVSRVLYGPIWMQLA